jgi:hypothetical protein
MKQSLESQFHIFHALNPHVYDLLVTLARQWIQRTNSKLGMKALFERARWETNIQTSDKEYTLNNNYTPFYARLIMLQEPDLNGLFNLREQKVK